MSVYVSAYCWKNSEAKGSTLLVLVALADIADDDGNIPPYRDATMLALARKTRLTDRAVRDCIRQLERIKELATVPGRGHTPSRYKILMRQLAMFDKEGDLPAEVKAVDKSKRRSPGSGTGVPVRAEPEGIQSGTGLPPEARIDVVDVKPLAPTPPDGPVEKQDYTPTTAVITWAARHGYAPYLHLHLGLFRDKLKEPAFRRRYTDLDAAFRNCVRADWGSLRKSAQIAAQHGRGVDLAAWWKTSEGVRAYGAQVLGVAWDEFKAKHNGHASFISYEIEVIDLAIEKEGFGAWYDERNSTVYDAVKKRRIARGAAA